MAIHTINGLGDPFKGKRKLLAIAPHEDDIPLCWSLAILHAIRGEVEVALWVVTNGDNWYDKLDDCQTIVQVRQNETRAACRLLGILDTNIHFLWYPESLDWHTIKHPARPGDPDIHHGMSWLDNSLTRLLRLTQPDVVLVPHGADYHPVHKRVYEALLISLFHASGQIWTEEHGEPIATPSLLEAPVYCDFASDAQPNVIITEGEGDFAKKLAAIWCFESQPQIAKLVENVRNGGAQEYLHARGFTFFDPKKYEWLDWKAAW